MNTKNVLFLSPLLLGLLFVSSCSNEEDFGSFNSNTKTVFPTTTNSRVISKSEIPKGAKIFVVKNEAEEKALTNRFSKIKILFVIDTDNDVAEHNTNAQATKSLERMADPESGSGGTEWYVKIKVDLIYYGTHSPITVKSSAELVGESIYSLKSWTETTSSANWTNSYTAIDFYVAGTAVLTYYVYNAEKKTYEEEELSCDKSYSGTKYL